MADTSAVYARINTGLKNSAEGILAKLGVSPSSAIQMLYSQIVLCRGIPFDIKLSAQKPTSIGGMSDAEIDAELMLGLESVKSGKSLTSDEFDAELNKEFGI